ncbi:hypothetical protein EXU29_19155, partial [Acinetobacter wuhouensis]|uniref:SwmB domain-containing protein n=1 Tax=Acinetobacter wuhouensis TaxID=1879050 RepID=UPI0010D915FA
TSNEPGTVEIKDAEGNVIGSGAVTGNDTPDNIQLTRPLVDGEKVTVTVTDVANNIGQDTATAGDVTAPELESASVNEAGQVILDFDEDLDPANLPALDSIIVTSGGNPLVVTGIALDSVDKNVVIVTTAPPIYQGQAIDVKYTDLSVGNDPKALQDLAGNDIASFSEKIGLADNHSTVPNPNLSIILTEVEGTDFTVNANELSDGVITVKGVVNNLEVSQSVDQVVVTITSGSETRTITVLAGDIVNGVWSADIDVSTLGLSDVSRPTVTAVATIKDGVGESVSIQTQDIGFVIDTVANDVLGAVSLTAGEDANGDGIINATELGADG